MKVLHIIDKSFIGGGQAIVRDLVEGLGACGVASEVACRPGGPLVPAVERLGVRVHPVMFDKRFRPGPARDIVRLVSEGGHRVVHGHGLVATTYAALALRLFGLTVPVLYHQHGFHHATYSGALRGLRKAAERWVARTVTLTIASNLADRDELLRGGYAAASKLLLLPNGIPEPSPTDEERHIVDGVLPHDGRPCVGIIGRLHMQKAIDVFLSAAARVGSIRPDVRFAVVGTGPLEATLHAGAASLGLPPGTVLFTGALPGRAAVFRFDVAVLCSRWEGLPITLLEYMAARRPIVCTDIPPCREVLGDGTAEFVPVGDPVVLAEAIVRLLADHQLAARRAAAARTRYETTYALARVARQYRDLYDMVTGTSRQSA